jgi:uncharacterized membrane protein
MHQRSKIRAFIAFVVIFIIGMTLGSYAQNEPQKATNNAWEGASISFGFFIIGTLICVWVFRRYVMQDQYIKVDRKKSKNKKN